MAEQSEPPTIASIYPNPPPFWQHFTPENLELFSRIRQQQAINVERKGLSIDTGAVQLLDLPTELRYLQPPEPPAEGRYRLFGDSYSIDDSLPSLAQLGITQLYTPPSSPSGSHHANRALILKRLAKSLLLNFVELTGILSMHPEEYLEKTEDIKTLFFNFHHLLNEYRPHQARESLILMMQDQLDKCRAETEGIIKIKAEVEDVLKGLAKIDPSKGHVDSQHEVDAQPEIDLEIWARLEKEFG